MGLTQIICIVFVALGVAVALAALFLKSKERAPIAWGDRVGGERAAGRPAQAAETDAAIKKIEAHLAEIDRTIEEFHSTATAAIAELDDKYQEMLFLYSLIDEKKKEVLDIYNDPQKTAPAKPAAAKQSRPADKGRSSHPRRKDILNLSKQGLSVAEIAQELNVGQDMVSLILEMGKAR